MQAEPRAGHLEHLRVLAQRVELDVLPVLLRHRNLVGVGGKEGAEFARALDSSINQLRAQSVAKFVDGLEKDFINAQGRVDAIAAKLGKKASTSLADALTAERGQYTELYAQIAKLRATANANDRPEDATRADALKAQLDNQVRLSQLLAQQRWFEGEINALLQQRSDKLAAIKAQRESGALTDAQYREQSTAIINEMQPGIAALTDQASAFASTIEGTSEASFSQPLKDVIGSSAVDRVNSRSL